MIGMTVKTRSDVRKVIRASRKANISSLAHAGATIRLTASRSIRRSPKAAEPGKPPKTRRGQLRRSIRYAVEANQQRVVIGPEYGIIGQSAMAHEFGGKFRQERYPKRPFMGPALEAVRERLPRHWAGSVR